MPDTDGEARLRDMRAHACDWVAAWSPRGIPVAAGLLAAAIVLLSVVPMPSRAPEAPPPGFWPVAEELMSTLPEESRLLLSAGTDVESMLTALTVHGG